MDSDFDNLIAEWQRIDPKFRESYARDEAGVISVDIPDDAIEGALRVLRAIPENAGAEAMRAALRPFGKPRPREDTDCWFCEAPSTPEHRNVTSSLFDVAICEQCARRALNDAEPVSERAHAGRAVDTFCTLCRSGPQPVGTRMYRGRFALLCPACAKLAVEIFDERQNHMGASHIDER